MLFDFSEAERNTIRHALEIYVTDLREEIVKTEKHEWREALHVAHCELYCIRTLLRGRR